MANSKLSGLHFHEDKNIYKPSNYNPESKEAFETASRAVKYKDILRQYASFFRDYPDIFVDMITPKDSAFKLFFYQRQFLRINARYRYVYATFTRAFSKSFISILGYYLQCIFYPGIKLFIVSGGKEQAANIAKEKIEEIWGLFPVLENELRHHTFQKDYVKLTFQNGSMLDIVAVQNSTRGGRRHGGLVEEVILVDGEKFSEVVIPLMNVNRRSKNGGVDPNENHKRQVYVTTAGYRNTFAYKKMIQLLIWMIVKKNAFVFGGDYRIPVMHQLLDENFVEELQEDGTYNPASFSREYESKWSGSSQDAFFDSLIIDKHRTIERAELIPDKRDNCFYIISADVARMSGKQNADTVAFVIKVVKRANSHVYNKQVVNIYVFNGEHFETQSIKLKRIVLQYDAKMLVVDANGLGVGLVDFLIKENINDKTGEILQPFSVVNDKERYGQYETKDSLPLLFNVKANAGNSSDMYVNILSQINSGRVKFLVDEMTAKSQILDSKEGKLYKENMHELAKRIEPYVLTSIMKEEMLNLKQSLEGKNIVLHRIDSKIGKDKFSALNYGLWYLKLEEEKNVTKRVEDVDSDKFLLIKNGAYKHKRIRG